MSKIRSSFALLAGCAVALGLGGTAALAADMGLPAKAAPMAAAAPPPLDIHGFAEFDNLTDGTQVVVNVKCLQVNDSDAVMTGFVLHSDDPNFPMHSDVIFAAIDSDLNPQIGTDFITPIFVFPDVDCHSTASPLTLLRQPPEAIQVVP